jgi:hypothetical protein
MACSACKQRKTKVWADHDLAKILLILPQCTGGNPCEACATKSSPCVYDATLDQRRKIANQRNTQQLAEALLDLERHRQLLGGIIATIRAGDFDANNDLIRIIRTGVDLSQLAAHVRNEYRANIAVQQAYHQIDFTIDGPRKLPSANQMLRQISSGESYQPRESESESDVSPRVSPAKPAHDNNTGSTFAF